LRSVAARAAGRIERLYVRTLNRRVRRGEAVYALYSPELSALQRQWLGVLSGDDAEMAASLRRRLLFLGMTPDQLAKIESSRRTLDTVEIASPLDGIVVSLGGEAPAAGMAAPSGGMDMGGKPPAPPSAAPGGGSVREGDYIREGTVLFQLASPASRWAMLTLLPADAARVRQGQAVSIRPRSDPGLRIPGRIDLVEPFVRDGELGPMAHVHLKGAAGLPLNTLVDAEIDAGKTEGLFVPATAVLDLGRRKVVWVSDGDGFAAREVDTGTRAEEWIEVKSGLALDDEIASDAQYLTDSETFIQPEARP
jgi:Cu(I)/Ag(I) efflux system membrane fusion protein